MALGSVVVVGIGRAALGSVVVIRIVGKPVASK